MKDVKTSFGEEAEPTVRQDAVHLPMWLIGLLGLLVFWSFNYISVRGGGAYDGLVYEPYHSTNELSSVLPVDPFIEQMRLGKRLYENNFCVGCHQSHGGGAPGLAPPLVGSEWVLAKEPNRIIRIPLRGLMGSIKVKETEWNLNMYAVAGGGTLNDEQVAAILTYVRNSWGNKASPVTPEQVAKVQEAIKDHAGQFTADELLKLPEAIP